MGMMDFMLFGDCEHDYEYQGDVGICKKCGDKQKAYEDGERPDLRDFVEATLNDDSGSW